MARTFISTIKCSSNGYVERAQSTKRCTCMRNNVGFPPSTILSLMIAICKQHQYLRHVACHYHHYRVGAFRHRRYDKYGTGNNERIGPNGNIYTISIYRLERFHGVLPLRVLQYANNEQWFQCIQFIPRNLWYQWTQRGTW